MRPKRFSDIILPVAPRNIPTRRLAGMIGFDSETYTTGKPFMFCTSDGNSFTLNDIPACFFTRQYRNGNFVCYNLKFDSGSLLYNMPAPKKLVLKDFLRVKWKGYKFFYLPHKCLRISRGRNAVTFWDIAQFYKSSLDTAAWKYLKVKKGALETKAFSQAFVSRNHARIQRYCARDSELTAGLADYLLKHLHKLKIYPTNLYSQASIAYTYFKSTCGIVDICKMFQFDRQMLAYAYNSYHGGKFEVTARGAFTGYDYDISSCYPAELAKLKDISQAKVRYFKQYVPEADYSFLRVRFDIDKIMAHSVPAKQGLLSYFPVGRFQTTITKAEYDYLVSMGVDLKVIDGWNIFCGQARYPYRDTVKYLYGIKENKDKYEPIIRDCAKIVLNGFYGKNAQVTEQPDRTFKAGAAFNPVYAAVITANARLRVSEIQNELRDDCLAVHTDSVIARKPLATRFLGSGLGDWKLKGSGKGILIACGMYQLGGVSKARGFRFNAETSWRGILEQMGNKSSMLLQERRVMSWVHAVHLDTPEKINVFDTIPKMLNLNCDNKRGWVESTTAAKLLTSLEQSHPRIVTQY